MSGFSVLGSKQLGLRHCSGGARSSEAAPITFQFDNVHNNIMSLSLTMTVTQPLPCNGPGHDTNSYRNARPQGLHSPSPTPKLDPHTQ